MPGDDGDAKAGCDRGRVERPYIESGAAQTPGDSGDDHAVSDRKLGAATRDQERSGYRSDGKQRQRKSDQKPDLGFRHPQIFVNERDHRRHDQKRHAHGQTGQPEQAEKTESATECFGGGSPGRRHA